MERRRVCVCRYDVSKPAGFAGRIHGEWRMEIHAFGRGWKVARIRGRSPGIRVGDEHRTGRWRTAPAARGWNGRWKEPIRMPTTRERRLRRGDGNGSPILDPGRGGDGPGSWAMAGSDGSSRGTIGRDGRTPGPPSGGSPERRPPGASPDGWRGRRTTGTDFGPTPRTTAATPRGDGTGGRHHSDGPGRSSKGEQVNVAVVCGRRGAGDAGSRPAR